MREGVALEAEGLSLSYGGRPVLDGVSLRIGCGERLAVIGRSGSGKTALARLLTALPPLGAGVTGRLSWPGGGLALAGLTQAGRRRGAGGRLGWLPQEAQAALHAQLRLGWQVAETLRAAGRPADRAGLVAAFGRVGLEAGLLERYPHQVSGGQAQRAALACVLAQAPAVLVADEPTSALDEATAGGILDLLTGSGRAPELALVLVTHDLRAAARCDRVLVLEEGRVVECGAAETVLTRPSSDAAIRLVRAAAALGGAC